MSADPILVVEDDHPLREALADILKLAEFKVLEADSGEAALSVVESRKLSMMLTDFQLGGMNGQTLLERVKCICPELPVLMMTAYATVDGAVQAMRAGAHDYLTKPFDPETLLQRVHRLAGSSPQNRSHGIVGKDPVTLSVLSLARRVARSDVTVMLTGESGTGKEVFARYIHDHSRRAAGPFVAINCAAIPEQMLEATLFGYEKGAFTGALRSVPGKFEQATRGTLLLDEISEMDLALQAKLLRVIQEREVERLGGQKTIELDVRVLATSNRDMCAEVEQGRFREDLYYRLNVFKLELPPLRDRRGDILPLAGHLLARCAEASRLPLPELTAAAQRLLLAHNWPGNVRELDNALQRALVLSGGEVIDAEQIALDTGHGAVQLPRVADPVETHDTLLQDDLRSREHRVIVEALSAACGNRATAAERLGISPRTLRYKLARMREAGVRIPGDRAWSQARQ